MWNYAYRKDHYKLRFIIQSNLHLLILLDFLAWANHSKKLYRYYKMNEIHRLFRPLHWVYDLGELNAAISSSPDTPEFWPESVSPFYTLPTGENSCYFDQVRYRRFTKFRTVHLNSDKMPPVIRGLKEYHNEMIFQIFFV